jgi:hypothetical protein
VGKFKVVGALRQIAPPVSLFPEVVRKTNVIGIVWIRQLESLHINDVKTGARIQDFIVAEIQVRNFATGAAVVGHRLD